MQFADIGAKDNPSLHRDFFNRRFTIPGHESSNPGCSHACTSVQSFRCREDGMFSIFRYFVTVRRATG